MQESVMASLFFFAVAVVTIIAGCLVLVKVKEKLPRFLVAGTLLLVGLAAFVWALFLYQLASWGTV